VTSDETLTLMVALVAERTIHTKEVARALDCKMDHARYVVASLHQDGALYKPRHGYWTITEKGRIACALAMYKDQGLHAAFFD
jgi:Mn-dependent DtxR family transcriptional regulator